MAGRLRLRLCPLVGGEVGEVVHRHRHRCSYSCSLAAWVEAGAVDSRVKVSLGVVGAVEDRRDRCAMGVEEGYTVQRSPAAAALWEAKVVEAGGLRGSGWRLALVVVGDRSCGRVEEVVVLNSELAVEVGGSVCWERHKGETKSPRLGSLADVVVLVDQALRPTPLGCVVVLGVGRICRRLPTVVERGSVIVQVARVLVGQEVIPSGLVCLCECVAMVAAPVVGLDWRLTRYAGDLIRRTVVVEAHL